MTQDTIYAILIALSALGFLSTCVACVLIGGPRE